MEKVKLEIVGMTYSQSQSGAYALVLGVRGDKMRLPIIIGSNEAQAIAIYLEKMKPTRPLTHDLFVNFANKFNISLKEIIISKFEEGIFYSNLICERDGEIIEIDSRTSDAVALAIRFDCPIYTYEKIIIDAGILLEDQTVGADPEALEIEDLEVKEVDNLGGSSVEDLKIMLQKAIDAEDYEYASKIRDELIIRGDS